MSLEVVIKACQFLLHNYPGAKEYKDYLDNRISYSSQNKYQFGYFPNLDNLYLLTDLVGEEILLKNKLINNKLINNEFVSKTFKTVSFENNNLIMPLKDPYGNILGLSGRSILSENEIKQNRISKYKNTIGSKYFKKGHLLFGLFENKESILEKNQVYIVEGQFDVIKASETGLDNIVALGSSNMTSYQFSVIVRYTNNIILLLDNDDAGEKGNLSIIDKFEKYGNIKILYLPDGYKDIDEFLSKNSVKSLNFLELQGTHGIL